MAVDQAVETNNTMAEIIARDAKRRRTRVVIVGCGFGGLKAAQTLGHAAVDVVVIDRTNHYLFQPMLYQVATAALAPTDIAVPIRWLLRKQENTFVIMGDVKKIDVERHILLVDEEQREIPYDYLIVAAGARHSYFGHPEWEAIAPGLKTIDDAREIRQRFLLAFENAEKTSDPEEQRKWLTFVVVGGGATGVELAGVMPQIAKKALHSNFRNIDTEQTRVILLEGGDRLLPAYPPELSERARRDLEELGVTVRTKAAVTNITPDAVFVGKERIECRTVFWGAGNAGSPLAKDLQAPLDKQGRVKVNRDLSVPGHPEIFAVGDLAYAASADGKPVSWVAQGAMQGGQRAAKNVLRLIQGHSTQEFNYFNKGEVAVIGRNKAVAKVGRFHFGGFVAWFLWLAIHIVYLAGFRNRLSVLSEWGYSYFSYERGSRLITREPEAHLTTTPAQGTGAIPDGKGEKPIPAPNGSQPANTPKDGAKKEGNGAAPDGNQNPPNQERLEQDKSLPGLREKYRQRSA